MVARKTARKSPVPAQETADAAPIDTEVVEAFAATYNEFVAIAKRYADPGAEQ
jgi:hypothetical protein